MILAAANETTVVGKRWPWGASAYLIRCQLALMQYRATEMFAGLGFGATYGALPFAALLPLPDNMSDDARLGFGVGLAGGSLFEFLQAVGHVSNGMNAMQAGVGGTVVTRGGAGVLGVSLGVAGLAEAVLGGVMAVEAVEKGAKALDILMMSGNSGGSSGTSATKGAGADNDEFRVTPDGVALPKGPKHKIPGGYIENPHRSGSYGEIVNGKFKERLRIDPPTPPGQKGPNTSHYHLDGKGTHYSPAPGDKDPGFKP
ncbi:hypothetical protein [Myxococcus sp. RHSTA-1-4]|uniref:hypothetical protein n=1 Tax=Myxococcus sp. RHSTA-1-4 TaxID=2874601 RepID=UPI001CBD6EB9|nr:hypothetical protein [Myxococcus sp. RHSTA-1-4]MBZ4421419.1 hypothetical protein [Myxococcus sp. RHSTA-1-4]